MDGTIIMEDADTKHGPSSQQACFSYKVISFDGDKQELVCAPTTPSAKQSQLTLHIFDEITVRLVVKQILFGYETTYTLVSP